MDFREVCDFFGGSVFIEELRGNLTETLMRIRAREDSLPECPLNSDRRAEVLLLKLIYAAFKGNYNNTQEEPCAETCKQALLNGNFSARWHFRARTYILLAFTWQAYPPLSRFCTLQRGPSGMLIEAISNLLDHAVDIVRYCLDRFEEVDPLDRLEFSIVREVWTASHRALEAARVSNPSYLFHSPDVSKSRFDRRTFENCCIRLEDAIDAAAELEMPVIACYAARLILEIRRAEGSETFLAGLDDLETCYRNSKDFAGVGICQIMRADAKVSSPFTSPIALNLLPVDGWDYLGSDTSLETLFPSDDPVTDAQSNASIHLRLASGQASENEVDQQYRKPTEHAKWIRRAEGASEHLSAANKAFLEAGSPRGQACIVSRKACLQLIQNIIPEAFAEDIWGLNKEVESDVKILEEAKGLLVQAAEMFEKSGDTRHVNLTRLHLLLSFSRNSDDIYANDFRIGQWGQENQDWSFARQLGLLAFRFGDHLRWGCGSIARSRWAYEIATGILHYLPQQQICCVQVQLALLSLHVMTGDRKAGKLALETSVSLFRIRVMPDVERAVSHDSNWAPVFYFFTIMLADACLIANARWENAEKMKSSCFEQLDFSTQYLEPDQVPGYIKERRDLVGIRSRLLEHEEELERGLWKEADKRTGDLITSLLASDYEHRSLPYKLALIDLCIKAQDFENGTVVLRAINDKELMAEITCSVALWYRDNTILYERRRHIRALEHILERCINLNSWDTALHYKGVLEEISPDHFVFPGNYSDAMPWQRALWLGLVEESQELYNLCYQPFYESLNFFYRDWIDIVNPDLRAAYTSHPDFDRIPTSLARYFIGMGSREKEQRKVQPRPTPKGVRILKGFYRPLDMRDWNCFSEALGHLERGKALSLAQLLSFDPAKMVKDVKAWDRTNYKFRLWSDLLALKRPRTESEEEEMQKLGENLQAELQENRLQIDRRPLADLTLGWPATLIGIPKDALVLYMSLSEDCLVQLAIDSDDVRIAMSDGRVSASRTRQMVRQYIGSLAQYKDGVSKEWLESIARSMSKILIDPFKNAIKKRSQVIFVPSGDLVRFPLATLLLDDRPIGLQIPASQAPSLSALGHIVLRKYSSYDVKFSIIARPDGEQTDKLNLMPPLPMAGIEALLIGRLFDSPPIHAAGMSTDRFREELENCTIMHLSTHGYFDVSAPLLSYISLKERFRVVDMLTVRAKAGLIVCSACLSGAGVISKGDDVLGFSHAMLAAGAQCYLGALWNANDVVTMLHMLIFYGQLALEDEPISLAQMWFNATTILYHDEPNVLKQFLSRILQQWDSMESEGSQPNKFVKNGRRKLQKIVDQWLTARGEPSLDLQHPYYWANFFLIGHANIELMRKTLTTTRDSN